MIVTDASGVEVPLSAVAKYRRMSRDEIELELLNGHRHVCTATEVETAWNHTAIASFPAEGAKLIKAHDVGERKPGNVTWTEHLVGFITTLHGLTIPVTLDGPDEEGVVLFADGTVRGPLEEWPTRAAYEEELLQQVPAKREQAQ